MNEAESRLDLKLKSEPSMKKVSRYHPFSMDRILQERVSSTEKLKSLATDTLGEGNFLVESSVQEDPSHSSNLDETQNKSSDKLSNLNSNICSIPSMVSESALLKSPDRSMVTPDTTKEDFENDDQPVTKDFEKCSNGFLTEGGVTVELVGHDLWKKFYQLGTEMIITKAGRRMFPTLKIRVSGLDPKEMYLFFLEILPFDDKRYRYVYHSSNWTIAGAGDPLPESNSFLHPESPASGQSWMSQGAITFDKLKLTNNRFSIMQGQVFLHSMHKYLPKIHIVPVSRHPNALSIDNLKATSLDNLSELGGVSFCFPETAFTTVTAYQNQQITKLKIASNPFAKGFREATRSRDSNFCPDFHMGGHPYFFPTPTSPFQLPIYFPCVPQTPMYIPRPGVERLFTDAWNQSRWPSMSWPNPYSQQPILPGRVLNTFDDEELG